MADAPPNSSGQAVGPPKKLKKKAAARGPKTPRSELTPAELAKLDAESAKRRNGRAAAKGKNAAAKFAAERAPFEAARHKADVDEKEDIVNKVHALLMLGICRPANFSAAPVGPARTGSSIARPLPLADIADHAFVARFSSAKVPRSELFLGVAVHWRDCVVHPALLSHHRPQSRRRPAVAAVRPSRCKESKHVRRLRPPCRCPSSRSTKCQHQRQRSTTPSTTISWRMSSTSVCMAMPTIPRRPRVRMATASTLPMKTLRPTAMLTTAMVTRDMKIMTSIAKVMVTKKRKASYFA